MSVSYYDPFSTGKYKNKISNNFNLHYSIAEKACYEPKVL